MNKTQLMLITGAFLATTGSIHAAESSSRYQAWQPPAEKTISSSRSVNDERLQNMIDELNRLIDDADKARAADQRFIEDLRGVVNQYDWPWRKSIMHEDFTDGHMNKDSNWKIIGGKFQLERGLGLHSDIQISQPEKKSDKNESKEDAAALLLGAILDQALNEKKEKSSEGDTPDDAGRAAITSNKKISNAFAIDTNLDVRSQQGHFEIGVYLAGSGGMGYRLVFLPGTSATLEVHRVSSRGRSIIYSTDQVSAGGDRVHQLLWTRTEQGIMKIMLNGEAVIETEDRSFKDAFSGVVIINEGGEFAVKQLVVQGT